MALLQIPSSLMYQQGIYLVYKKMKMFRWTKALLKDLFCFL